MIIISHLIGGNIYLNDDMKYSRVGAIIGKEKYIYHNPETELIDNNF